MISLKKILPAKFGRAQSPSLLTSRVRMPLFLRFLNANNTDLYVYAESRLKKTAP